MSGRSLIENPLDILFPPLTYGHPNKVKCKTKETFEVTCALSESTRISSRQNKVIMKCDDSLLSFVIILRANPIKWLPCARHSS